MSGGVTKPAQVARLLWWPWAAPRCVWDQLSCRALLSSRPGLCSSWRSDPTGSLQAGSRPVLARAGGGVEAPPPPLVHTQAWYPRPAGKQEEQSTPVQADGIAKGPVLGCMCWGSGEKGRDGAQRLKPWDPPDLLLP